MTNMREHMMWWSRVGTMAMVVALAAAAGPGALAAQELVVRPVPSGVVPPPEFARAIERGWRSTDGQPGHSYWQNWVGYDIDARLDPETARLEGTVRILYHHDAPANLASVFVHLHQNIHQAESPRNEKQEITGGVTIKSLSADGEELQARPLSEGAGYEIDGTIMQVRPTIRLERGDTLQLDIEWEVTLPQNGAGRIGYSQRDSVKEMFFVGYWFPKMAVFDNLRGWNPQPYLGNSEFYDEFGDYEVDISVPAGWTVMATGELQNPREVFTPITIERLDAAAVSDTLVTIADQGARAARTITTAGVDGWLTYRYTAKNVRDFTFTTSNVQRWDATSAVVPVTPPRTDSASSVNPGPDRPANANAGAGATSAATASASTGTRRVLIHSFWREDRAPLWSEQWLYGKQSIEHHSRYTGFPYPWSHMTSVEGADIITGGMEFPMMTVIGPYTGQEATDLFNVTSHEIGHMWVPMIVGSDEKRHAWMDEGSTTFLEDVSKMELWPGVNHHRVEARTYLQAAAAQLEQSMMRHGDYYEPGPGYGVASYSKPATLMVALRGVMGAETWEEAYRAFISEWAYKHPSAWDFFNTFERFHGEDLDWFWTSFYYETWTLDHAVRSVTTKPTGGATVTIEDRSAAIFPVTVRIRTSNGMDFVHEIPVSHWLEGNATYEIEVAPTAGTVTRVEVDPSGNAPDVDRSNNFWPRG